jgi:hypothetical protein
LPASRGKRTLEKIRARNTRSGADSPVRVSEYFNLGRSQSSLDFVDVDIENDTSVFIEPGAIRQLPDDWGAQCEEMLASFFDSVLDAIRARDHARVDYLVRGPLSEPDETHLGWSKGASRGRGVGGKRADLIISSLEKSKAATKGLLQDLEDSALFIEQIGPDIISDITTNVCKGMLLAYTQSAAERYSIPLEEVPSGPVWDPALRAWEHGFTQLPMTSTGRLLLVPKILVRYRQHLSQGEYYRRYLIPKLAAEEMDRPGSQLTEVLKSGERRVSIPKLQARYPNKKEVLTRETAERPEIFHAYKEHKRRIGTDPMTHGEFSAQTGTEKPDFNHMLGKVEEVPPGQEHASQYHLAVEELLTALFYPALADAKVEYPIHEGRKRIDITYTNNARQGFFSWIRLHSIPCRYVAVECKNYQSDPANPELDQLSSRFSPLRGQVGLLVCRTFKNRELLLKRCRDTALDHRGYVIPIDDADLRKMVFEAHSELRPVQPSLPEFSLLKSRFDALVS